MTNALLALDAADAELVLHAHSDLADGADATDHGMAVALAEVLQIPRAIRILTADFRRVALRPDHAAADAHDGILVVEIRI
jgi:hypothetical protein